MTKRAAKYRRISQDREGRELGIQRQDEDLDDLARRSGLTVVADYTDNDMSASRASRKSRPGYQQLLADARAGHFDTVLAYTTGRLTRRPREFEDLIDLAVDCGIEFEYVRSPAFDLRTAQGRRVARTLAAHDAGEAEELGERVSRAARQRAEQGLHHGGHRCFGWSPDGRVDPVEAAEVVLAAEQLLSGVSLGAIARDRNARGVSTVRGGRWMPVSVRDNLVVPRHAGLSVHRGQVVGKGRWPAILSEDVHHAVVALLTNPARRTSTGTRAAHLLSGIARCGLCGGSITSQGVKAAGTAARPGRVRPMYKCRACHRVSRRRDWVDDWVTEHVLARVARPDAADLLVDADRPDTGGLRVEAAALQAQLDDAAMAYARRGITLRQLETITADLTGRLGEIQLAQAHTSRAPVLRELVESADPARVWEVLSLDRRRAVVASMVEVVLLPGGSGKRTFQPECVRLVPRG